MRSLVAIVALVVVASCIVSWHRDNAPGKAVSMAGEPQIEVSDTLSQPNGGSWPAGPSRSIVMVTSSTCPACSFNQSFENKLFSEARALGLPVFYLLSSDSRQDEFAHRLSLERKTVLRADLVSIGVSRTPTVLAIDKTGRVLAIRTGTISPSPEQQEQCAHELLFGISKPLYSRIANDDVTDFVKRTPDYQIIELRGVDTPLPSGLRYRRIPMTDLSVRAAHEIAKDTAVLVDCNTAKSAMACQNALLFLSSKWGPDRLFAINLPARRVAHGTSVTARR